MKVLNKGTTPNGINIQIEDWSEDFTGWAYGSYVAVYPKAYARVRCECEFETNEEALKAFNDLAKGITTIFDYNFTVMESSRRVAIQERFDRKKFDYIYSK